MKMKTFPNLKMLFFWAIFAQKEISCFIWKKNKRMVSITSFRLRFPGKIWKKSTFRPKRTGPLLERPRFRPLDVGKN